MDGAVRSLSDWVQAEPEEVRSRLTEGRAMDFFKRTDNIGPRKDKEQRVKPAPRPAMSGAQALLALQANMEDPWADED
jgi:hypothetical protein